jgi:hypothetical protein
LVGVLLALQMVSCLSLRLSKQHHLDGVRGDDDHVDPVHEKSCRGLSDIPSSAKLVPEAATEGNPIRNHDEADVQDSTGAFPKTAEPTGPPRPIAELFTNITSRCSFNCEQT